MGLRRLLAGRRKRAEISEELREALATPPAWMYPLELADGSTPPLPPSRAPVCSRDACRNDGADRARYARDCWSTGVGDRHRVQRGLVCPSADGLGAAQVRGVDVREVNIRRAELVREHYGIDAARLTFEVADALSLEPGTSGTHDVVLMIGLVYPLENPIGALRVARALTRGVCVVEAQVTEQHTPITSGVGVTDRYEQLEASWAAKFEPAQDFHPMASHGGVISLVPNLAALLQAMEVVVFRNVRLLEAPEGHNQQYVQRHRAMVVGYA